ncbi:MAG: helicase [Pseudomonadota bacterium]
MQNLPIDQFLSEISSNLKQVDNLVLIASPGAGKTTRVPPELVNLTPKKILMLQPRRIAARASAERIAKENHWRLGEYIGYRVRFEDCTTPESKIIIVTEALLLRELLKDPELSEYGIIIFDEFHERNLYSDSGLAAVRELQQLSRPDLKIIVMSATIDANPLLSYLNPARLIEVPGRTFPVDIFYDQQSQLLNTDRLFIERVTNKIVEAHSNTEQDKHILVFLPGLSEIQRVEEALKNKPNLVAQRRLCRLHGSLSLDEQHSVLQTDDAKIILATNVAETSLTIDGVTTVVDSGLARELQNDQRRLYPWLKTTRISRASAEQRKGRAGRQNAGRCYRLWTKLDDQSMPPFAAPDILTQDLSELLLVLLQLGVSDPQSFTWFEQPPQINLERSLQFLLQLELIAKKENIFELTEKGRWIQRLPLNPRLGAVLYQGAQTQQIILAAQIGALLNERDPWGRESLDSWQSSSEDSDLIPRLSALNQKPLPREFSLVEKVAQQLCRQLSVAYRKLDHFSVQEITDLLISGFADRIGRRRRSKETAGLVIGQRGVELSQRSLVRAADFFISLTGHANESNGNAVVDLAHPLTKSYLIQKFSNRIQLKKEAQFFPEKDSWMSVEQKTLDDLPIEEPSFRPLELNSENLIPIAKDAFQKWKQTLPILVQLFERLQWAKRLWPDKNWPEGAQWENDLIEMACLGETSLQAIKDKDWNDLLLLQLSASEKRLLRDELPEKLVSPRGRPFSLVYETNGNVSVELKIQEAYGWKDTPTIAQTRVKVRMILLGPHMRPLQTTDDLASFWKGTYQELRPSLKARYPKHQWPEDPSALG